MIDCPNGDIRDLLPDLLHDRLSPSERARVEPHVASCEPCRAELALLRDLRATMGRTPLIDVASIAAAIPAYRAPVRRTWTGLRAAAVIAAIAVGGTSIALVQRESSTSNGQSLSRIRREPTTAPLPNHDSVASNSAAKTPSAGVAPTVTRPAEHEELAMGNGAVNDLTDRELATLLSEIESLDALPSEDVESTGSLSLHIPLEGSR
jgi:anti-sigma factor RsiW